MSKKAPRFAGKVILVTGASSGIGRAVANAFAAEGATLMLAARRVERLTDTATACRAHGARCEVLPTDVRQRDQVLRLIAGTIEKFGRIDVLVNNAGLGYSGPFHQQPWEEVETTLRTNLEGAMALCHAVIPQMLKQRSGSIVNVSSVVGKRPVPDLSAYCASKFGLWGFTQALRLELKPHGIHVCHFCPASTQTEFQQVAGLKPADGLAAPDSVARALVEAVVRKQSEWTGSLAERVLIQAHFAAPAAIDGLLGLIRK